MKELLQSLLEQALQATALELQVKLDEQVNIQIEHSRDAEHGDFASNIAMVAARQFTSRPRQLAEEITARIPVHERVEKVEIAGPGFINFYLQADSIAEIIPRILQHGEKFGGCDYGHGKRVLVEFVSANPTGPLHIGHGRGAAYGDTVSSLLQTIGYNVSREYYVNDAGRQMDILTISIWLKYLHQCGLHYPYPDKAYQAAYIGDIAKQIYEKQGHKYESSLEKLFNPDWATLDTEVQLDNLILTARTQLGHENFQDILNVGLENIMRTIRHDLEKFGVTFNEWFSERSLSNDQQLEECIAQLKTNKEIYIRKGASWFASTRYGDEKDRVVKRDNGAYTYFAADIAYHVNKLNRGFDQIINIWGSDHHGYISRVKASLTALGKDADKLTILLVQFASLYRGNEKVQMSTRSGQYVTLAELLAETGTDAARFFYVMRRSEQHLDFDLDLAKSQSNENPVYYIQYAHARICRVWRQLHKESYDYDQQMGLNNLQLLDSDIEQQLIRHLSRYEEQILSSAKSYAPHSLCFYLKELAQYFHSYYNSDKKFLTEEARLRHSRLSLLLATRQILSNGLTILGVSAPEEM